MSEVVRARLEALLAEVQPRRFQPTQYPAAQAPPTQQANADDVQVAHRAEAPSVLPGPAPDGILAHEQPPRRAAGVLPVAKLRSRMVDFGREHLAAVVVVLLVGCAWTAYTLLQARSTPVAVAAAPSVVASPTPTPTPIPRLLVHVLGAVRQPGLVQLAQGARVADAIEAAGGLTAKADPGDLNLAALVADGDQVVIGTSAEPGGEVRGSAAAAGGSSGSGSISLNTATLEQLDTLAGVGPVTAQKILDWREAHGRFTSVAELQEVDGIGPKTYAEIAPSVRV
ncbi:MAG TPA: helix-hairpin-helix domain-containing protein [Propionicimonas sp.]|nr:helix-hairpin-helix domain-containing protein [Propionicimonas sp.]HRA07573.1 helix-hairpin-helix domain-containing protein [Propionicimonas sp.]